MDIMVKALISMYVHNIHYQMVAGGKNAIYFGVYNSSSVQVDNNMNDISVLGESPTHRLDDTARTAEANYSISFTETGKGFVLSLHYNGSNGFLFVIATKIYQSKVKDSEIKPYILCLGNILKDFTMIT